MRWLILTSSTGTGHNMRAHAIRQWADRVYGSSVEVRIHQTLEEAHPTYRFGVGLYNFIQRWCPRLHHIYFNFLEIAALHKRSARIRGRDAFIDLVAGWEPDRIISVHPHTNHGFFDLARRARPRRQLRCITYCGELSGGYGFSRHWINLRADGFIGATEEVCAAARAVGMPLNRIFWGGFLLRPAFYAAENSRKAEALKMARELGLDRTVFTILLSTGTTGANNHLAILRELAACNLPPVQIIALCSHRHRTRERVLALASKHPQLKVWTFEHTERMLAIKRLASVVVARPGTGTTSEAIQLGVPLVLNTIGGVMPQELITVQFCRLRACAYVGGTAAEIVHHLRRLMNQPRTLSQLSSNMAAALPKGHPEQIMHWIYDCP